MLLFMILWESVKQDYTVNEYYLVLKKSLF